MAEHQKKLGITQVMTEEAFVPKAFVRQPRPPPAPRRPARVGNNLNDVEMPQWMVDPDNEEDEVRDQEADEGLAGIFDNLFDENDEWDEDMFDRPQRRGQA